MTTMPTWAYATVTILGMACVTVIARGFFLFTEREMRFPEWLQRALQAAPLAAIVAVTAPEIVMTHGTLTDTWHDARLAAAVAATLWYAWKPGVLGPLLAGMAAYLPLRILLGW